VEAHSGGGAGVGLRNERHPPGRKGKGCVEDMKVRWHATSQRGGKLESMCEQGPAEETAGGTGQSRLHMILSNNEEDGLEKAHTGGREVLSFSEAFGKT